MISTTSNDLDRFSSAARAMMDGDLADAAAGRFSTTVFTASDGRMQAVVDATVAAACDCGLGLVVLEFGPGSKARGPQRYTAAVMVDGAQVIVRDCMLWLGADGRALLVPRDRGLDEHVRVTDYGLELRSGRPAISLAAGTIRATNRLVRLARDEAGGHDRLRDRRSAARGLILCRRRRCTPPASAHPRTGRCQTDPGR